MPKDALLVERQAPFGRQVGGNPAANRNPIVQRYQSRISGFQSRHRPREGIAQAGDHLEHRQIGIGNRFANQIIAPFRIALEHLVEVIEKFGQPLGPEVRGAPLRFTLLLLIVETTRDRMVGVVGFGDPIGDRQL